MTNTTQANKANAYEGTKRRLKIWFVIVALFMGWALYTLYTQIGQRDEAELRLAEVQQKIDKASKQMDELQLQVDRLNDPEYIAQLATKDLNLVREGEKPIRVK
ncbi:FtsB family cell division protein [Paenibacillus spongiae]|uniref:Septum formation initiator family protein n=1 Tax=Paenibacillus spongiae TaxID=2909671 RepID=A0ABY5SCB7_9BACL|nr:septum formation initiator family protein [Paenibacillus spongiae]UVI30370.1 septum formation initiator family protein [Paenibacillus spongiae]